MDKRFLENCLEKGMSLEAFGESVERHPSTVSYWLEKYGLSAAGKKRHSPNGAVDPDRLPGLVEEGASIRQIAAEFDVGYSPCATGCDGWDWKQIGPCGGRMENAQGWLGFDGPI